MEFAAMLLQSALVILFLMVVYTKFWRKSATSNPSSATYYTSTNNKRKGAPPVAAGAKPILGHLHMLMGDELPHHVLGKLADKHGPAFLIHVGPHPELVVSSWELAKECFTTNDKCFTNRPSNKAFKYLTYDEASVGFAPYGPLWIEMRKVSKSNLLSNQRIQMQKQVRATEVDAFFNELYQSCSTPNNYDTTSSTSSYDKDGTVVGRGPVIVEMNKWFEELTLNLVTRMVSGKEHVGTNARRGDSEAKYYKKVIDDAAHFMGNLVISDIFPSLGWLDYLLGHDGSMKKTGKELDSIFSSWVKEHQQKRKVQGSSNKDPEEDFIDITLSAIEESQLHGLDTETFIKSICVGMILGGSDTTSVALTWVLSLLLNNRDILEKAQDELDQHVGKERKVDDSDINNLVYLGAIVKESMRLYQVGPLIEREATEDCNIGGFHVKKGSRLMVNIWKVQQDPTVWSDPSEFRPERFLSGNLGMDVKGQHFELIPFGSGRRMCPGLGFALNVIHLVLARLLHSFDLATPLNAKVDMTETSSVTNYKGTPLQVLLTPRLKSTLYDN
ncbi:hypothetical protein IFM89_005019 [Coptis chinensis]|uniref:Cytochrome P450 n=1 Tax=Coptis chinensis TaxID=261450 RepID=A0A835HJ26_9MAGN|nr:hypothetical protein IFM89_005019 [Coptis chinensis]